MPSINLVAVGILFGILQIAILIGSLVAKKKTRSHRSILAFFAVLLLVQFEAFMNRSGFMAQVPHLLNIATPFIFLFGPLLYFHTQSNFSRNVSFKEVLLHITPFIAYFCYSFFFFLQPAAYKFNAFALSFQPDLQLIPTSVPFDSDPWNIQGIVVVELLALSILIYSIVNTYLISRFKRQAPEANLSWTNFVTCLSYLAGVILILSQGGLINGIRIFSTPIPAYSADLFATVATYAISIYILIHGIPQTIKAKKYYKSNVSNDQKQFLISRVLAEFEDKNLYMNPGFSLKVLSDKCKMSKHHISQVLNEELGMTFFELTNKYRIEEAKKLLSTSDDYIKMEQLAYQLGYKSKSTFFTAFKRSTDLTPLKYRQRLAV